MNRHLRGAAVGLLVGTVAGLVEAWVNADPTWGGLVWLVGPLVDGALGAAIGLAASAWAPPVPPLAALGAAAVIDALAAGFALREPPREIVPTRKVTHPDILWIAVEGVPDSAIDPSRTPNLAALAREGVRYRRAWAPSAAEPVALATLLTGRTPAAHGAPPDGSLPADVPTVAEVALAEGMTTRAVLTAEPSFARGFVEVIHPRPPRVGGLDPASANVLVLRALDAALGDTATAPRPAEAAAAALPWLADDAHQLVFVHLIASGPDDAPAVDAAAGALIDALRATGRLDATLVAVTGVMGDAAAQPPTSDAAAALRPEALHVPLIVRLPSAEHAGAEIRRQIGTHDVGPSLLGPLDHVEAPPWEGEPRLGRIRQLLDLDAHAPQEALALSAPWPVATLVSHPPEPPPEPAAPEPPLGSDGKPDDTPRKRTADPRGPSGAGEAWEVVPGAGGPPAPERAGANLCDAMVPSFGDEALLAVRTDAEGGWYYALRAKGYALHTWGEARPGPSAPWRLFDLKHDPDELGRPLARDASTCDGSSAADLAARLLERIPAQLDASAALRGRALVARSQRPGDAGRASMPDPTRPAAPRAGYDR